MAKQEALGSVGPRGLWEGVLDMARAVCFVNLETSVFWVCLKIYRGIIDLGDGVPGPYTQSHSTLVQ